MQYEVIEANKADYPIKRLCTVLGVSESGYYAWVRREPSQRSQHDEDLQAQIVSIWQQYRGIYGAPRIHAELREKGIRMSRKRAARLMRQAGIQGKIPRRKRPRTTQVDDTYPVAPNVLNRQFDVRQAHQVWLSDITYIDTEEGYLYLVH